MLKDRQEVVIADIEDASLRLANIAYRTPLLRDDFIDNALGSRIFFKAENLQKTGSFKIRGAFNKISALISSGYKGKTVVCCSSGNHAQAVAFSARQYDLESIVVMPRDAPRIKVDATRKYGAKVVFYDRQKELREQIGYEICHQQAAVFIHPYDEAFVIAGQGTLGLEVAEQLKMADKIVDTVIVPASGGGLMAGTTIGIKQHFPLADVFVAEAEHYNRFGESLRSSYPVTLKSNPACKVPCLCDAIMSPSPGKLTYKISIPHLKGAFKVSDEQVKQAMFYAFRRLKLVLEPSGAVALAALLANRHQLRKKNIVIILSGGNVDEELFACCIAKGAEGKNNIGDL